MEVRVFDKRPYEGEPDPKIRRMIEKLAPLGRAVVAVRGSGFSVNLVGTVYIGYDGADPVLRVANVPPWFLGKMWCWLWYLAPLIMERCICCGCHIHIKWGEVRDYALAREDVSYGPEPVVYLLGMDGEPVVRIFYPGRTYEEVQAALA